MFAVNSGDQVAGPRFQIDQRFRTHRLGDINGQSHWYTRAIFRLIRNVFRAYSENDFFIGVRGGQWFEPAFKRKSEGVFLARFHKKHATVTPLDFPSKEVHGWTANEAGDKEVIWLPVQSQRIGDLHNKTVAHNTEHSKPRQLL